MGRDGNPDSWVPRRREVWRPGLLGLREEGLGPRPLGLLGESWGLGLLLLELFALPSPSRRGPSSAWQPLARLREATMAGSLLLPLQILLWSLALRSAAQEGEC